jgi:uncharacterized protein (TIGR02058 family)
MGTKRFIVEIGTGADLHGEDVTKAACRAVKDAIWICTGKMLPRRLAGL